MAVSLLIADGHLLPQGVVWYVWNNILTSSHLRALNPHKAKYIFWIHKWYSTEQGAVAYKLSNSYSLNLLYKLSLRKKGCHGRSYTWGRPLAALKAQWLPHLIFSKLCVFLSQKEPTGFTFTYFGHFVSSPILVTLSRLILKVSLQSWL